jgi:hypothetical protein
MRRHFHAEKGICHISETTITQLPDPSAFTSDPFINVLRDGARELIEQAIHAELEALPGPNAKGLSAKTVTRLKADWWQDYEAWQKRGLGNRRFLYVRADGVYFKPRMAEEKQYVLVIIGADDYGRKALLAMTEGLRESTQNWRRLLLDLKRRGLCPRAKLSTVASSGSS